MSFAPLIALAVTVSAFVGPAEPGSKWRLVGVVIDGKDVPLAGLTVMTVEGDAFSVTVDGEVYQKGTAKVDASKSPRESEISITEGPGAGAKRLQISKVEGDVMISAFAPEGRPRPEEFKSKPGSGHTLSVWFRAE